MIKEIIFSVCLIFLLIVIVQAEENNNELAHQLVKKMDEALFPNNFVAKIRMINHKPGKEDQTLELYVYNKNEVGALTVMLEPPSEKGKKMLFINNIIWLYVPGTSRALSLSARQPFMGSTFSNSDVLDSTLHDDFNPNIIKEEAIDGKDCYCLELTAKDKTISHQKIIIWIRKDYIVPIKIEYYTLSGKLLKTTILKDLKKIAGQVRPSILIMENELFQGAYTTVEILGITEKNDLSDSIFTLGYLTK